MALISTRKTLVVRPGLLDEDLARRAVGAADDVQTAAKGGQTVATGVIDGFFGSGGKGAAQTGGHLAGDAQDATREVSSVPEESVGDADNL